MKCHAYQIQFARPVYDLGMFARVGQSTTLILLALLACADGAWRLSKPQASNNVDETLLVRTIQQKATDKTVRPDVLVVGSSLSFCFTYDVEATHGAVDAVTGEPVGDKSNCQPNKFLSKVLSAKSGKPCNVYVVALPGAMGTDIESIVEGMFAEGKAPKVVVYTAAPRDFVDRLSIKKAEPYAFSAKAASATQAESAFAQAKKRFIMALTPANARKFDQLTQHPSLQNAVDFPVSCASQIYEQRSQTKSALTDFICHRFNRSKDIYTATQAPAVQAKPLSHFEKDLANYTTRYVPPDFDRLKQEGPALQSMAKICAEHGSKLIVVNMPLSAENKKIIDPKLYSEYKNLLTALPRSDSLEVVDTDPLKAAFDRSKFLDSAHLNRAGSKQLQELLAPKIAGKLTQQAI